MKKINGIPRIDITFDASTPGPMVKDVDYKGTMTITNAYGSDYLSSELYAGKVGFSIGGNFTADLPKKPINITLLDSAFDKKLTTPIMRMSGSEEFRLLANYDDSLVGIRTAIGLDLWGKANQAYTAQLRWVELWIAGVPQGLYQMAQRVKRSSAIPSSAVVKIANSGADPATAGYLVEFDNYIDATKTQVVTGQGVRLSVSYPSMSNIVTSQADYLNTRINAIETELLAGNLSHIDIPSWANAVANGEVSKNDDKGIGSTYFIMPVGAGSKLIAVSEWDMGTSLTSAIPAINGAGFADLHNPKGWYYNRPGRAWYSILLDIPAFKQAVEDAYIRQERLYNLAVPYLQQTYEYLKANGAFSRNAALWDFFNTQYTEQYLDSEYLRLQTWLKTRLAWLRKDYAPPALVQYDNSAA